MKKTLLVTAILLLCSSIGYADYKEQREMHREKELNELQKRFEWWPTDANPGPVKDPERGGYTF